MTPEQITLARAALCEMKTISIAAPQPHSAESLSDVLQRNDILNGSINLQTMTATGFSSNGLKAIFDLAKTFRPASAVNTYKASNATLAKVIAAHMIGHWNVCAAATLSQPEFDQLQMAIETWFADQAKVRQHVVPCTLFPHPVGTIAVGPVIFHHVHEFPYEAFGTSREEFWPTPPPRWKRWLWNIWCAIREKPFHTKKPGGFNFEQLLDLAGERHAPWMALVDIPGRAIAESINTADFATDIALAAIQIVCPGGDTRRLARATGRAVPVWRVDVSRIAGGEISLRTANDQPALARSPQFIIQHLSAAQPLVETMGRRLIGYLRATSSLPDLDEAWCNAAYWYHEALAERLDTVAVAKLETAIEVLFRAESMSGSKQRLLDSFDAMFGLKGTDPLDATSTITVEQLVLAITTARSRVLHGTWPTLHTDLPSSKGKPAVSYADVEAITRILLLQFATCMDAYLAAGETEDSTDALIAWIKTQRAMAAAAATTGTAGP